MICWIKFTNAKKNYKGIIVDVKVCVSMNSTGHSVVFHYRVKCNKRIYNTEMDNVAVKPVRFTEKSQVRLLNEFISQTHKVTWGFFKQSFKTVHYLEK